MFVPYNDRQEQTKQVSELVSHLSENLEYAIEGLDNNDDLSFMCGMQSCESLACKILDVLRRQHIGTTESK